MGATATRGVMAQDRPDLISDLYHEALQRPLEDRDAFLSEACAGDEALRREVESLLGYESASRHFLESPAIADAALAHASPRTVTEPPGAFVPASTHRLAPDTILGRYRIEALVGVGGMGEVYRAWDPALRRRIALKTLPAHLRANQERQERFEREARAIAQLRHPHICTLYDVGHDESLGLDFLVMEYIEGETLAAKLRSGALDITEALRLASQVASALAAAHAKGLIHRDIKPSNIILTPDENADFELKEKAIVVDFGLARGTTGDGDHQAALSHSGVLVGTPNYMSPEQVRGKELDSRTDIFSLAVVLFECLTGRLPFDGATRFEYLHSLMTRDAEPLAKFRPETPPELQRLVAACLERDVSKRIDSATSLSNTLSELATGAAVIELPVPRPRPWWFWLTTFWRKVPLLPVLAVVGVIALAAGVAVWVSLPTVSNTPTVLAILPAANPADDPIAELVGAAMVSVVSRNLGTLPGLKTVSGELTAPYRSARVDLRRLKKDAGVSHVLDLTVRQWTPSVDILARLFRPGVDVPVWEMSLAGDIVEVQGRLLAKLRETLAPEGLRSTPGGKRAPPAKLPTSDATAFMAYVEGRALLDRPEQFGNVQRAQQLFERAIDIDSRFAVAHAGLADALRGRYATERDGTLLKRAMQAATTAVQLDSDSSAAHVSFAAIQNQLDQKKAAITSLERAIDLQPDNDDAHRWMGEILADQNQVDAGVAELRAALRIRASFTNYSRLGAVLFKAGRYTAAIEAYEKALEVRPNHGGTYEMLGVTHDMLGHLDQAIGNYEHAIRVGATATAYSNLAMAYFGAGAYEKSRTAALNAIARDPNKPTLHRTLGDIYLKLNRKDDARAAYDKAIAMSRALLEVNPKDAFSIVLIAVCEANLGRRVDAERHAVEALALQPTNRGILYRVAKVHALTGNRPEAFKALRGAIEQGYDREAARRDPELASLRSLPEFEKVLSEEVRK
jgi:tetratricopeptide (TPR) repeat protein/TolB-like protein